MNKSRIIIGDVKMQNGGYLFAAFAIVWVVVFGYVLFMFNKQRKLHRELNSLKEEFKQKQE